MLHCPTCKAERIQRSRLHSADLHYLLLLQRPYRCSSCGTRFFRSSWIAASFLRSWFDEPEEATPDGETDEASFMTYAVNRRAWIRFTCDLDTSCEMPAGSATFRWPARMMDISRGGACLMFHRPFEQGTTVHIRLDNIKEEAPPVLVAEVLHCRQEENGRWSVGCRFLEPLPSEQLEAVLA